MPFLELLLDLPPPQNIFYMSPYQPPITILTSAREPDCEPGLVVDSINMENPPLIPGALLVRPTQHKPGENLNLFSSKNQWNLGGRSSLVSESRVAKDREPGLASRVLSKEKTFKLVQVGSQRHNKYRRSKSLDIWEFYLEPTLQWLRRLTNIW